MIIYFDTSALLKLFVAEEHSPAVRRAAEECRAIVTHWVAYCEAVAAFGRRERKRLEPGYAGRQRSALDAQWRTWRIVGVSEPLVRRAADLALVHGLKGFDSLHLAAAHATCLGLGDSGRFRFAAFDRNLVDAARQLAIQVP